MKAKKNPAPSYKSRAAKLVAMGQKIDAEKKRLWNSIGGGKTKRLTSAMYYSAKWSPWRKLNEKSVRIADMLLREAGKENVRSGYKRNPSHIRPMPKNVTDKTYTERVKLRGYNGPVSVFSAHGADAGKVLRKLHPEMTREEHLAIAAKYRKRGYQMDTLYANLLNRAARQTWGRPWRTSDYRVSGIGSDEFSASMKKRLRDVVTLMNAYSRAYRAHEYAAGKRNVT